MHLRCGPPVRVDGRNRHVERHTAQNTACHKTCRLWQHTPAAHNQLRRRRCRLPRPRLLLEPTMMPADHAPGSDGLRAELARLEVECVSYRLDTKKVVGAAESRIGHDDAG